MKSRVTMKRILWCIALIFFFLTVPSVDAEPAVTPLVDQVPSPALTPLAIPPLTQVEIEIDVDLGSKISTTGAMFPLHLSKAIVIDGREVIPAGTAGQGEVVHAKKAGGSGSAGELVLAARFLSIGDRILKLRSMRVALAGQDAIHTVDAVNAASAASPLPIGLLGFAITGRNILMPKGTVAMARTAELFPAETLKIEQGTGSAQGESEVTSGTPTRHDSAQ